jgi:hypothetical protein
VGRADNLLGESYRVCVCVCQILCFVKLLVHGLYRTGLRLVSVRSVRLKMLTGHFSLVDLLRLINNIFYYIIFTEYIL